MTVDRPIRLGVLAGLQSEAAALREGLPSHLVASVRIELSGARQEAAIRAAEGLAAAGCTHLMSWGLAGALAPGLVPGRVLLPTTVMTAGTILPVDAAWHERLAACLAPLEPVTLPLLGVDDAVSTVSEKAMLRRRWPAIAIDMESHHLAHAARWAGLPFAVIRVVADDALSALPPAAAVSIRPDGSTDLVAVLGSILRAPGQISALIRLGRAAGAAHRTLLRCSRLGGVDLFGIA